MGSAIKTKRRYWLANGGGDQNEFFVQALNPDLWSRGGEEDWTTCWRVGMPAPAQFRALRPGQSINHLPGNAALTVKSRLYETLSAARDRAAGHPLAARYDFFPTVYAMPERYHDLQRAAAADPDALWLKKPKRLSRGRGIELLKDAADAPKGDDWMVQAYLDRPHLYERRKYVLRCYVAVTSVEPLRAYFYDEGFIKLASEDYGADALDNPFAYLTNPDINAKNEAAERPVVFITFADYRRWLRQGGADDAALFARIRDMLALSVAAAREEMRARSARTGADLSGCYELLGFDCMVDADLKPWILECNLSPSLDVCAAPDHGGIDERRVKTELIRDLVSLVGLNDTDPRPNDPNARAEREAAARGRFQSIAPGSDVEGGLAILPVPRLADHLAAGGTAPLFERAHVREIIAEGALSLYDPASGELAALNETAAVIWLQASDGVSVDTIAGELAGAAAGPADAVRREVWNAIGGWAAKGWLRPRGGGSEPEPKPRQKPGWVDEQAISVAGASARVQLGAPGLGRWLAAFGAPSSTPNRTISVVESRPRYALAEGPNVISADVSAAGLGPALLNHLLAGASQRLGAPVLMGLILPLPSGETGLILSWGAGDWAGPGLAIAALWGIASIGAGVALERPGSARGLAAPARRPAARNELNHVSPDGSIGALETMAQPAESIVPIDRLIIPRRRNGRPAQATDISAQEALAALYAARGETAPATVGEVERLAAWAAAAPAIRLDYPTLEPVAIKEIAGRLG